MSGTSKRGRKPDYPAIKSAVKSSLKLLVNKIEKDIYEELPTRRVDAKAHVVNHVTEKLAEMGKKKRRV